MPKGYKHGLRYTPAYKTWAQIKTRCENTNYHAYHRYGGRGILCCERWKSLENFVKDMGQPPPNHQLDRKNNDGHYEPSNCRWVTRKEQNRNKSTNKKVTLAGITLTVIEWAEKLQLNPWTIYKRLERGWPPNEALRPFTS